MTHFINGEWISGSGAEFSSVNPATGETIWKGKAAGAKEVDAAFAAARQAFASWGFLPVEERIAVIKNFGKLLGRDKASIIEKTSQDCGKVKWDATNEIGAMIGKIDISITAYNERTGVKHADGVGFKTILSHKPHGVVAVFGPYNFPAHLPNGHIVPALIAGNTIVYKPSEQTPFVTEAVVKLWEEAGLPKGVINLVQGERATGELVAKHPELDGLFFTGSSATGKILHQQFAGAPQKILALELGGNNPLVVWNAADVKAASYHIVQSAFMSTGQRCTCARRLIIQDGAEGERLLAALVPMVQSLTSGVHTATPEPFMGPIINQTETGKLLAAQDELVKLGGKILVKMNLLKEKSGFISAGIIDVTAVKDLPDREYFGPLLQVIRVKDFDSAIRAANNTQYGLSAGIFSDDKTTFEEFLKRCRAGVINWNRPTTGSAAWLPFGGPGVSGNHRPSAYYAADYCAYPVSSSTAEKLEIPAQPTPGVTL